MNIYILSISIIGFAALAMAWMPSITEKIKISYSIIFVILGGVLYSVFKGLPDPLPTSPGNKNYAIHITEMMVIISLMGTGLKIDDPFSFKGWATPFRLITITMLLCIGILTALGMYALNFPIATALLLGAALAPTDPVLAADVQVGPPLQNEKENTRFSLTAEAGLNDGMAFPFTWLAIVLALTVQGNSPDIFKWVYYDLIYRTIAGIACGYLFGKALAWLTLDIPGKKFFLKTKDGFVAISATLLVYGITELIHGYGFIAVFVTAITIRNYELHHKYHLKLHSFTDQIERILLAVVLILFGGMLVSGILKPLTWEMALVSLVFIFIIRPLTGYLALTGTNLHFKEKLAISFFGIKGIGSFYYLAFAVSAASFTNVDELWAMISFVVLISILIHGFTATLTMKKIEEEFTEETKKT
ncbi:cation:proton antiporter [Daejeonella oryzae]|uniref:cation:proton antiporter n=1 Tax=Daejeonella oryzae TaxID=1122943 RepID=UPI00041E7773|nr:cation:proton antiporter [Daejeonella oryzae]